MRIDNTLRNNSRNLELTKNSLAHHQSHSPSFNATPNPETTGSRKLPTPPATNPRTASASNNLQEAFTPTRRTQQLTQNCPNTPRRLCPATQACKKLPVFQQRGAITQPGRPERWLKASGIPQRAPGARVPRRRDAYELFSGGRPVNSL